jgi:hypothetical protein
MIRPLWREAGRRGAGCRACVPCRTKAYRGIQIFGGIGLGLVQNAPAKGDHPPARILNGQHQPPPEPVIGLLAIDDDAQASLDQQRLGQLLERAFHRLPPLGRIAEAELLDDLATETARAKIGPRCGPLRPLQLRHEEALRRRHGIVQSGLLLGPLGGSGVGGGDLHPRLLGQILDGIHEGQAPLLGHPADDVAMRPAAETVIEALFVIDEEAGRLFPMEGAAGPKLAPRLLDAQVRPITPESVIRPRSSSIHWGRGSWIYASEAFTSPLALPMSSTAP